MTINQNPQVPVLYVNLAVCFFVKDGTLVYYKSASETDFGCRGAISIQKAIITPHEFDEMRFDVAVNDCVWYLRANTVEEREKWICALEAHRYRYPNINSKL
jgi:collagen type IV alpha-3-binding protein